MLGIISQYSLSVWELMDETSCSHFFFLVCSLILIRCSRKACVVNLSGVKLICLLGFVFVLRQGLYPRLASLYSFFFLSHFVVALAGLEQAGFELTDLSPATSQVLGLQPMPTCPVYVVLETELKASCVLGKHSTSRTIAPALGLSFLKLSIKLN